MQEIKIGNYEVTFSKINNRKRSLLRRRLAAMSTSFNHTEKSNISEEEQEMLDGAKMMNHEYYEEVRDLIFSFATIKGEGNALTAFDAFANCFEYSDDLEFNLFKEGLGIYMGKQLESSEVEDTPKLTQL